MNCISPFQKLRHSTYVAMGRDNMHSLENKCKAGINLNNINKRINANLRNKE